ncbi:MAG: glycosyltransferase family 9 protein [Ignavibacteriaceae bacterium]
MIYPKNLLIVRTDRIGDVVLSLPLAKIIKKHYSDCKVTFLVKNYTKSLVENHPFVDKILVLKESNGKANFFLNIKEISGNKFDYAIIVYPTFFISLIIFFSGIKQRIGTGYRWYSFLFNRKIFVHRKFGEKHELEFNVDLLKEINITENISAENVSFDLQINPVSEKSVNKFLAENGINKDKPIIIIHPGSGGSAVDLPVAKFKELVELLDSELKAQIILTGTKSEFNLCEALKISGSIKNFAGEFDLQQMIALISMCAIFISNSTGPLHIAAALGKYVVGFYPKILACSAERWGPYSSKRLIFVPEINCENCTKEKCEKLNCMDSINIQNIFVKINNIYKFMVKNGEINA